MNDAIICGECPAVYRPDEIVARREGGAAMSLGDLNRLTSEPDHAPPRPSRFARLLGIDQRVVGNQDDLPEVPDFDILERLQPWTFTCAHDHEVDGNQGVQFPLAVLGASGASKSHFLPAIVWDLGHKRVLSDIGITLRDALYKKVGLTNSVVTLYERGLQLPTTGAGELLGPYGYKLQLGRGAEADSRTLLLFDIAGESLSDIIKVAGNAKYVLLCKALVILVDPVGVLRTQFDTEIVRERDRLIAATRVRNGINVIVDTLQEVWRKKSSTELTIPVCITLAKADAIEWDDGFAWAEQTDRVLASAGQDLHGALVASSNAVRQAFVDNGGGLIVDEIEERLDPKVVRYTAASATSHMPEGNGWSGDPDPQGVALTMLQALDLAGIRPNVPGVRVETR